ncbi:aminoglycoside phosphotransferase family protein [Cuneatibacter caecimuris]|uniref:Aminoglycoside phosphotransferase (APT) family kinase protein n=1 Tax=Cuneatibacter caecimuris TaxID=1796618 RepID=A0A4Q7PMM4_9FIRM|nr:aminoglycoside phosphotransferase family protein [Cuneatibacter caecimuris]RZT01150.1 aminoglycoside phosphotransferase (APT) family kinase protein [Cuneatibacter caecimuris]
MDSLTKNRQSRRTLEEMAAKIFAGEEMENCTELTEGYFNVAYEVRLKSGKETILKVAPQKNVRVMSYEKNIMFSEVQAMKMAASCPEIPVPEIYGYDSSCTVCPSPYFFMEKLEGASLFSMKDTLPREEISRIQVEAGGLNRKINEISCPCFGLPGQPKLQGEEWFPVFRSMLELGLQDAEAGKVDLKISGAGLLEHLEKDKDIFYEVKVPKLVHWDLWDGNIFVQNGKITGFIDWERSLWADPLMEVGFRTYKENEDFIKGYGIAAMAETQRRRALWYDIYLLVLVSLECEYRKYETMEMYEWSTGLLARQFGKL